MRALVADVGGTHARFALTELGTGGALTLIDVQKLKTADHAGPAEAIVAYLDGRPMPEHVALAVATPITGDEVRLTNAAWAFSQEGLKTRLGVKTLCVLNDFEAIAHAMAGMTAEHLLPLTGTPTPPENAVVTVMGPGTGLGVAILDRRDHKARVIPTEGGHASFAPTDAVETAVLLELLKTHDHVSVETLVCGPGFGRLHRALAAVEGRAVEALDDMTLWARAISGEDLQARESLRRFARLLGAAAGDAALAHGSRAVVIAGGLVPRFTALLGQTGLVEAFRAKGRFRAYMERVPLFVCTHPDPGLDGAGLALQEHLK